MNVFSVPSYLGSKGFSMVEVLVGMGLLSALALGSLSLTNLFQSSTNHADHSQQILALTSKIRKNLENTGLCRAAIGPESLYNQGTLNLSEPEVQMRLPNIKSGPAMGQDFIAKGQVVLADRLKIDSLRLKNLLNFSGTRYVAQVELRTSNLQGKRQRRKIVSTVLIDITGTSPTASISNCWALEPGIAKNNCEAMGCTWDASQPRPCACLSKNGICPIGELPVAFKQGLPDCRPIGGKPCASTEYLVGVGIEKTICAPVY